MEVAVDTTKRSLTFCVEGKIVGIDLDMNLCEDVRPGENSVVLNFVGDNGRFINIIDYRRESVMAYDLLGPEIFKVQWPKNVPCLGTMRKRSSQYLVLADQDGESDIVEGRHEIYLIQAGLPRKSEFRVLNQNGQTALHPATGICLAVKRPARAELGT